MRLAGIIFCVLFANVLNYALGRFLSDELALVTPPVAAVDGSTFNTSRYYLEADASGFERTPGGNDALTLLSFYAYLDGAGKQAYTTWRSNRASLASASDAFRLRAVDIADANNTGRYLSLLLLILTLLLLFGKGLKETNWWTPLWYLLIFGGTTVLYGSLSAWLFTATVMGTLLLYFLGLRLFLPIYHTEWTRLMRPGLTFCLFLLATMAWRGPELVDYWFWTSPAYRLGLVTTLLLTLFFHFSILRSVLITAKLDTLTQVFAFGMPLGVAILIPGLMLGLYGSEAGDALRQLNYELVLLPPATVAGFNGEAPFVLSFAGVALMILAGIGYFIQKIAN